MLLRLDRILEEQRLQIVLLKDQIIYTTDTCKLYIGDGETIGGIDLAEAFVNGSESFISECVTDRFQQNGIVDELNQAIDDLRINIANDIDKIKDTISQNVITSTEIINNTYNQSPEFRLACRKGTAKVPENTEAGDKLFGITFTGLKDDTYRPAVNIEAQWSSTAVIGQTGGDARVVFSVGTNSQEFINFNFDHTGTLSAPNIKTGPYTTQERDALTPAVGTIIYNSTINKFQGYQNTNGTTPEWVDIS
jgi:hypothetical protein